MTLDRQMYPENVQHLMRHFKEATSQLNGYLLVDLKQSTPESARMRSEVFKDQPIQDTKTKQPVERYMRSDYKTLPVIRMSLGKYRHQIQEHLYDDDDDDDDDDEPADEDNDYEEEDTTSGNDE
ncbi:putative metallocarboxypeptidase ecm14 [Mizuhopecten yessoensis]|uniref:putative metallocarboxypeptidase ecm14 n=1 Tax=Mizuhopecten yessoensis TaxID=6573 RepID=UPI000B459D40|nr:putative metallocarboxypeptidase ecm14 [Mizuhopecten yessoensis]